MDEVKPQTEREAVIQHFIDRDLGFEDPNHQPVDLVIYLAKDVQNGRPSVFENQRAYVERVVKAGVHSNMAKELFRDVRKAVQTAAK